MTQAEKAVLQTLAYSALFHFPLTKDELWQFLISDTKITKNDFTATLKHLPKQVVAKNGFFALADEAASIKERKKNVQELQRKMQIAKHAAFYLSYIQSIQLIGISGGVASGKAEKKDDIDFFIITKKKTLYMTRIWVHAVLEMLNLRRKRFQAEAQDKICVNLLVDERQLSWPENLRDIYTAHEIASMKPLFDRKNTYKTFLNQNLWIEGMLPNVFETHPTIHGAAWKRNYVSLWIINTMSTLRPLEKLAAALQKNRMKRIQTTETITETLLAFHPLDYRRKTLTGLHIKLRQLGLLTNK